MFQRVKRRLVKTNKEKILLMSIIVNLQAGKRNVVDYLFDLYK